MPRHGPELSSVVAVVGAFTLQHQSSEGLMTFPVYLRLTSINRVVDNSELGLKNENPSLQRTEHDIITVERERSGNGSLGHMNRERSRERGLQKNVSSEWKSPPLPLCSLLTFLSVTSAHSSAADYVNVTSRFPLPLCSSPLILCFDMSHLVISF